MTTSAWWLQTSNLMNQNSKIVVVVVHIYPPVTGQCQILTIGQPEHFSLQRLLHDLEQSAPA